MPTRGTSRLTPELTDQLCRLIKQGNHIEPAIWSLGVSENTYYYWMRRGMHENEGRYRDFYVSVCKAKGDREISAVSLIRTAAEEDWKAQAWLLEKTVEERYGRRVRILSSERDRISEEFLRRLGQKLDAGTLEKISVAIAELDMEEASRQSEDSEESPGLDS